MSTKLKTVRLTAKDRETLREFRKASRRGVPFTRQANPWHADLLALMDKGILARTIHGKVSYWYFTDAGRDVLKRDAPLKLRPIVAAFAERMERKLRANEHKGGWEDDSALWLLGRLKENVRQLNRAVGEGGDVLGEAADVANYAMMVADVCDAFVRRKA